MRNWKRLAVACMTVLASASGAGAAEYETQANKPVGQALTPAVAAGPDFTVKDPVVADGYMYRFTVASPYGPFDVTGTGIPKGVGRLFGNVVTSVTTKRNPSQESRANEVLLVGSFKRDYAARFNVDPYSSNRVLQEELDKIGKAAALGSWTASAAMIPISGPASSVITATSLGKSFNNILATEPPSRIRIINEDKLKQMGVSPDGAKAYLDQPVYTPTQNLLLVDSLSRLGAATGRDAYLTASLVAADEDEANFFVNMAQILRGYHETVGPITGITMVGSLTVAQTKSGAAVIPFALDYGVWTANADRLSQNMKATYKAPAFNGSFEFWVTGSLSSVGRQELEARGYKVV